MHPEAKLGYLCRRRGAVHPGHANLSERADPVQAGVEKIVTRNGESCVAVIEADRLDRGQRRDRERIHLLLVTKPGAGWKTSLPADTGVAGSIGGTERMSCAQVGDVVKMASRVQALNKASGTRIRLVP